MRAGILVAGNWIIDQINIIDVYPQEETLANILEEYICNGGCAYNVAKALYKLHFKPAIEIIGVIGDDDWGKIIIDDCKSMKFFTEQLYVSSEKPTSYTQVMSVKNDGKRTFFHHRGANSLLDLEHFNFEKTNCKIFHLGYLLLLDQLDQLSLDNTTKASQILASAKKKGLVTAVDLVSEDAHRFQKIVHPSLPYIDYLFLNEFELLRLTGINPFFNNVIHIESCLCAAEKVFSIGFKGIMLIHFESGALAVHQDKKFIFQPSISLKSEEIKGKVGAGDAFAAGVLFGIHENWNLKQCLELGVSAAYTSLQDVTPSNGIKPFEECLKNLYKDETNC